MTTTTTNDDKVHSSSTSSEATPQPEGPPQRPMNDIWQDDSSSSLASLPPMPSPLEYSASTPLVGSSVLVLDDSSSLFSDKSLENRLHQTLNQNVDVGGDENRNSTYEPRVTVESLRQANLKLLQENTLLIAGGKALEAQRESLVEAKMTAELRERESRQQVAFLKQELEQSNEEKDKEIQELKARLKKMSVEQQEQESKQQSTLDEAMKDANEEMASLRNQNESLEQEKKDLAKVLEETQTLLEKATEECATRKASVDVGVQTTMVELNSNAGSKEHATLSDPSTCRDATSTRMNVDDLETLVSNTLNQNTSPREHSPDTLPIGERLCRIRDAAERASLIEKHEREISRLSAAHEAEMKQLLQRVEQEKDSLLEEAMVEMNAGYKGLRRRLEKEHDKNMKNAERNFRTELERVRKEAEAAEASSTESLDAAMAQVASANQCCQREMKRREVLEKRLEHLQVEYDEQTKALANKHATDISKLGHGWEEERRSLVDSLQRECNSVFDRTKSASPRSVKTEFFADIELIEKQHILSPQGERPATEVRSPTFTELDRTLRETEALVEKVLNSKIDD